MQLVNQAVILAAGECSRFFPFTRNQHKSTFIIGGKPIIVHTLNTLRQLGISKVEIVESPNYSPSLKEILADNAGGMTINFHTQMSPVGTGNAIIQALPSLEERFLVIDPQQININEHLDSLFKHPDFLTDPHNLIFFSKVTNNPGRYGMFALDGFRLTKVVEKPTDLTGLSDRRNVGMYLFTKDFVDFMNTQPPTEFQLIDAINLYLKDHSGYVVDAQETCLTEKYAWDLFGINKFVQNGGFHVSPTAHVGRDCQIGENVNIEDGCRIDHAILKNCLIGKNTIIESGFISDSIIGNDCHIGKNFNTKVKNDTNTPVETVIKNKLVSSGMLSFGVLVGDGSRIGDNVVSLPGSVLAPRSTVDSRSTISPPVVQSL
jgi:NDP-sugar pyrophosphorylase family protein